MSERYLGWILANENDTVDVMVHAPALTLEQTAEFAAVASSISDIQPLVLSFLIVQQEYDSFVELAHVHAAELRGIVGPRVSCKLILDQMTHAARSLTAFLGAASAFLSQAERKVAHCYGAGSDADDLWNELRRERYSSSLSYALMYKLRNYAQHYGLPVSLYQLTGSRKTEIAPLSFSRTLLLDRDSLLNSSFDWGKSVSDALKQQAAVLDVAPIAADYFSELHALFALALTGLLPQLEECQRYLRIIRVKIDPPAGAVPVVFFERGSPPHDPPSRSEPIPDEQLSWILDRVKGLFPASGADVRDGE